MTSTHDGIDIFFGQQVTRVRVFLGTTAPEPITHRGMNPARMEGSTEDIYTRCYTRRETMPSQRRPGVPRYRGF